MSDFQRVFSRDAPWSLRRGSCLDLLRLMPDCCVDSCVTDPPYELGFMGKSWDLTGIAYSVELWSEIFRVLKPGAHLLSFGGTRTYHRMACAIEDAGFEIRDSVHWIYGAGMPHALNISKAIDKADGLMSERVVTSTYIAGGNAGTSLKDKGGTYSVGAESSAPVELARSIGATEKSREWDGWFTGLRPSHESIVVARKPLEGTSAANILNYGTGALHVDACRVPRNAAAERGASWAKSAHSAKPDADKIAAPPGIGINQHPLGGWPGNVVFTHSADCTETECADDCPCESLCDSARYFNQTRWSEQDAPWPMFYSPKTSRAERELGCNGLPRRSAGECTGREDGSAGLTAFAGAGRSSKDGRANFHPTVKPLALIRWLCRLVTPPGGIVLEPFGGSGTGIMAPILEGFRCISAELTPDYYPIIDARVAWAEKERASRLKEDADKLDAIKQLDLFGK